MSDESELFREYMVKRAALIETGFTPRTVLFSPEGLRKALLRDYHKLTYNPSGCNYYAGLPYKLMHDQKVDIVVTHEALPLIEQRLKAAEHTRQNAITIQMKGPFLDLNKEPVTMVKLVAQSLDAATLCDIVMEWLGADCNWGEFEKELHAVVEKHGKFE